MALLASAAVIMTVLDLFFSTISPAAAPWVAANKHSNKSKMTSAGVEVFVMLTFPQKAHPREEHTANQGDIKTDLL